MAKAHWFKSTHWSCWHPYTWQGWLITMVYIAAVLFLFITIDINSYSSREVLIRMALPFIVLSIIFIIICKRTSYHGK